MGNITKNDIETMQNSWAKAVQESDADKLLSLYHHNAILKPTLSNSIRRKPDDIASYFTGANEDDDGFLNQGIVEVNFDESSPQIVDHLVFDSGVYRFRKSNQEVVSAHFSFVFIKDEGELKILSQHSSLFV